LFQDLYDIISFFFVSMYSVYTRRFIGHVLDVPTQCSR
jgi:hypothetical protein